MAPLQRVKRPNGLVGFDDDCMPSSLSVGLQYGINAASGHIAVRSPQYNVRKTLHHNMYVVLKLMLRRGLHGIRALAVSLGHGLSWNRPRGSKSSHSLETATLCSEPELLQTDLTAMPPGSFDSRLKGLVFGELTTL